MFDRCGDSWSCMESGPSPRFCFGMSIPNWLIAEGTQGDLGFLAPPEWGGSWPDVFDSARSLGCGNIYIPFKLLPKRHVQHSIDVIPGSPPPHRPRLSPSHKHEPTEHWTTSSRQIKARGCPTEHRWFPSRKRTDLRCVDCKPLNSPRIWNGPFHLFACGIWTQR